MYIVRYNENISMAICLLLKYDVMVFYLNRNRQYILITVHASFCVVSVLSFVFAVFMNVV